MDFDTTTDVSEVTTPNGAEGTNEAQVEETATDTTPATEESGNENTEENSNSQSGADEGKGDNAEPTITVKYNKQMRNLSLNEATEYAQMGMKFESMQGMLDKLNYLAAANNQSAKDFIEDMYQTNENMIREKYSAVADGDEKMLEMLITTEHNKNKSQYDAIKKAADEKAAAEYDDQVQRVAREFVQLREEFPEIKEFKELPKGVIAMAEKNNISLLDAKLRYDRAEQVKADKAKQTAKAAGAASAGSAATAGDKNDSATSAMLRGLWGS